MRSPLPKRAVSAALILLGGAAALLGLASCQGVAWNLVTRKVRHDFPTVQRTDPAGLARWLGDPNRPPPLLLDVRTRAEFDVSHLPGAQRVEPGSDAAQLHAPRDRPIVTYCSVGYRSADFAAKLQAAGFQRVENLEGSIFQWANEGRPVVGRDGARVGEVHPYDRTWGNLLAPARRARVPPADGGR